MFYQIFLWTFFIIIYSSLLYGQVPQKKNQAPTKDAIDSLLDEYDTNKKTSTPASSTATTTDVSTKSKFASLIDRASIPNIFIAGDMLADISLKNASEQNNIKTVSQQVKNGFFIREVEFGFSGAVDQLFNATFLAAMHNENGAFFAELHELYIELPYLPYNLYAKVGRFFVDVGKINGTHRHDWNFTVAPLVHNNLFDAEGVYDTGGELSYLMPFPFFQEVKVAVFTGRTFGHTHNDGFWKPHPLYTARIKNFFPITHRTGIQWGGSFLRYSPTKLEEDADYTYGSDLTLRWLNGKLQSFIWSSEIWYREKLRKDTKNNEKIIGAYSYVQYQPWQQWSFGLRLDFFSQLDAFSVKTQSKFSYQDYAVSVWVTYRPSEFAYLRATVEQNLFHEKNPSYILRIQMDFILGFHPAHAY